MGSILTMNTRLGKDIPRNSYPSRVIVIPPFSDDAERKVAVMTTTLSIPLAAGRHSSGEAQH